jgi:hypothetical protein
MADHTLEIQDSVVGIDDEVIGVNALRSSCNPQSEARQLGNRTAHANKMNAHFKQPQFEDGQVVEGWNLTQLNPHTKIGEGVKGLTFKNCNLLNCDVPKDAKVIDCLTVQKDFCSHNHPDWVEKGIEACGEDCKHYKKTEEETIDNKKVARKLYVDKIV